MTKQKSIFRDDVPLQSSVDDFTGAVSEDFQPPPPPLRVAAAPSPAIPLLPPQSVSRSKLHDKGKEEAVGGMEEVHHNTQLRPRREVSYQHTPEPENQNAQQWRRDHNHSYDLSHPGSIDPKPYDDIAEYMPEFEFRGISRGNKAILAIAVILAIIASLYNAQFAGIFGSFISEAPQLVWYLSFMAFFANVPINIRSIKMSVDKVRSDLVSRWKPLRLPLPDDQQIKNGIVAKAVIAGVGAFPPMLFAIEKPLFDISALANWGVYLPLMGTQLAVVGAQNLRGVTIDDDMYKQAAVFHIKEDLLYRVVACLDGDLSDQLMPNIKSMAQGKVSAPSESKLKGYIGTALGWTYFGYVGIHAAATGLSVYRKLNKIFDLLPEAGFLRYGLPNGLFFTVGGISFLLRWLLLGRAAKGFVDSIFALGNRSFFKLDDIEVIDSVFDVEDRKTRTVMQAISVSVSATVGISSLGSASQISHANFFNDSPEAGLMVASFAIGGGAAGPINTLDFKNLLDRLCGYLYIWGRSKGSNYNANDRFGESRNEFLLKFMRIITAMSVSEFANLFLDTINSSIELLEEKRQQMGITAQQYEAFTYLRKEGLFAVGYTRNSKLQELHQRLDTLRSGSPRLFDSWKRGELPGQQEKVRHDAKVKQEAKKTKPVEASPSPKLTRGKSVDDSTPLVKDGGGRSHSIN